MDLGVGQGIYTSNTIGALNGTNTGVINGAYNGVFNENLIRDNIVRDGLVLLMDAANNKSYCHTNLNINDLSVYSNNGVLTNGTTWNALNKGSLVFDGTDDFILGPASNSLNFGTGNFTINVWFRTTSTARRTILSRFDYNGLGTIERGYYIDVQSNGRLRAAFETSGLNYRIADSTTAVNTNRYFFASFVRSNATTANMYVNGVLEGTNTFTAGTTANVDAVTAPFSIGRRADYQTPATQNFYLGNIAVVQMYNRALSQTEILQNFIAQRPRFI